MTADPQILLEKIRNNRRLRIGAACESHELFFAIYLSKYAQLYPSAPFHHEIFALTENPEVKMLVLVAFRESAKSTICTTSFPIWSILTGRAKFVVIASGTFSKARTHLSNIREEVENNDLLKNDLGPFKEQNEWGAQALVFPKYGAKIMAISSEQSVRGIRYKNHRPDLIVADDLEDLDSVRTQEGRDRTYRWFKGELLPAGSRETRVFVIGNLLHQDSLIVRLQKDIDGKAMSGEFRSYAILDDEGKPTWPGKYSTAESLEAEKRKISDTITWEREYMIRIISPDDQIIKSTWIRYYKPSDLPKSKPVAVYFGVDLAIKEKESNDFTAIVVGKIYNIDTVQGQQIFARRSSHRRACQDHRPD